MMGQVSGSLASAARCHIGLTANDGLDIMGFGFLIKIDGAKEIAMVGHRDSGHPEIFDLLKEGCELVGPIQEAILSVQVKMNKL
jgi:hypothetical protein